jgi:hypothetical protein
MVLVMLIPLVGAKKVVTVGFPAAVSVRDAILSCFPELSNTRIVVFDGGEPISLNARVGDVRSGRIIFWPYTLGG